MPYYTKLFPIKYAGGKTTKLKFSGSIKKKERRINSTVRIRTQVVRADRYAR